MPIVPVFGGGGGSTPTPPPPALTPPATPGPVALASGSTALPTTSVGSWSASVTVTASVEVNDASPAPTATITGSGAGPYSVAIGSGLGDGRVYAVTLSGQDAFGQIADVTLSVAVAAAGAVVPIWLDVPTQIERMISNNNSLVYTFTLNTPTNGTPPYSYRVLGGNANNIGESGFQLTGNVLELVRQETSAGAPGASVTNQPFRVLVWDSAGNFGVGILLLRAPLEAVDPPVEIVEEKVLDYDEDTDGWLFAAQTLPAGWTLGGSAYSQGDCVTYPIPLNGAQVLGEQLANCAPGSCAVMSYGISNAGTGELSKLQFRILRRKVDVTKQGWSWAPTSDFLDWDNLSSFTPTVPLVTGSAFATVTETIAATGRSYRFERAAYTPTAGVTPTFEVAEVSGGVAVLESQNSVASTRVAVIALRPALNNTAQSFRQSASSSSLAVLCRMRAKITLTGDSPAIEIKVGGTVSTAPVGIRMEGVVGSLGFGGDPIARISALRTGSAIKLGGWRRSVWTSGAEIGIDFMMSGATTWLAAYPWDPTWTDYPEWDDSTMTLDVPQVIGPVQIVSAQVSNSSNAAPYSVGGVPTLSANALTNITNDMGIVMSVQLQNRAGNGGRIEISNVNYFWKMQNLQGVVR